jgi:hypothetical protein
MSAAGANSFLPQMNGSLGEGDFDPLALACSNDLRIKWTPKKMHS